ncbi:MAG: hypothetical protein WC145_13325 [Aliarcobacter sp.]|jgi:hypothetical protein
MLYYPNVASKANHFCIETVQKIRRYLETRTPANPRGTFSAPDLTQAGIEVPRSGFRLLQTRGWIRCQRVASNHRRFWRLTESALTWLDQQQEAQPHVC